MKYSPFSDWLSLPPRRRPLVLSLVGAVASDYIQLRALDEQLVIAARTKETYAESARLFELQCQYGLQSRMTVEQARTQYETAAAVIPSIESQIAQTENALSILLGRIPGPIPRGRSITALLPPDIPAGVPSQVLERRPDIRQAEQQLIAANAQIGAARALSFPTISLTGALGIVGTAIVKVYKAMGGGWVSVADQRTRQGGHRPPWRASDYFLTSSTRRFLARPSSVRLSAMGAVWP